MNVVDEVDVTPNARIYAEGWQSWSPTTWSRADEPARRPSEGWEHLMRFRPGAPMPETGHQGEGLLVVDPGDGSPVRTYAARNAADDVPTIRAEQRGGGLVVSADGPVEAAVDPDAEQALAGFGARFAAAAAARVATPPPRVWCTWYRYFGDVTAADVVENLRALDEHRLRADVVQIDDGWSLGAGAWSAPDPRFGSLPDTVAAIRDTGRRAGIWLAPFCVGVHSDLATRHPDWLTGPAGVNWGDDLVGLDLTHPAVRDHLATVFSGLRELGIDYFKLDFLYAGAVPGRRWDPSATPVSAYRSGLGLIRSVVGQDATLLGCGAPILPSVGLVDAMRVASDTFHEGGEDGSQGLRGRMSLQARAWQDGVLWRTDPDCLVARPAFALREEWARVVLGAPGIRGFSDRIAELDARGFELVRALWDGPH